MTFDAPRRAGFSAKRIQKRKQPHPKHYLKQRVTFWVAVLSLFAFVTGNMVGRLGWYGFWASVMGKEDDSLIVYSGTEPPVREVPDDTQWSLSYGGDSGAHTFSEVPRDLRRSLPAYVPAAARDPEDDSLRLVYSVDHLGRYSSTDGGGEGSHAGIDIRLPTGTPVYAVMNGVVEKSGNDPAGFGIYVLLRHPNVPDPDRPTRMTTLYSHYAHLSAALVTNGQVVRHGDQIAASGRSGNASGPHLHFQIDRNDAPWHPYWPFSSADMREANLSFSQAIDAGLKRENGVRYLVNPMLYVQANYAPVQIADASIASSVHSRKRVPTRQERMESRLARLKTEAPRVAVLDPVPVLPASDPTLPVAPSSSSVSSPSSVTSASSVAPAFRQISRVEFEMAASFKSRSAFPVKIRLFDSEGRPITNPDIADLPLLPAFGQAEFRPAVLKAADFRTDGTADIDVKPLSYQTLVFMVGNYQSPPVRYAGMRQK
ncbi:MAG: peptidase M23 [Candidatus Peregrinibacteria bacterium Greene0416_19]|nr:MAG: peptidase M23 [Candidatus Peregrinibacteria bacterium Greene0416_19]